MLKNHLKSLCLMVKICQNHDFSLVKSMKSVICWLLRCLTGHLNLDLTGGHSAALPVDEDGRAWERSGVGP